MGKIISKNKIDTTDNTNNIHNIANIVDVDVCAICLNNVKETNKKTTILDCKHYYHTECIDVWLTDKNTCPYCMQVTIYKPKAVNEIKKETVINIINNNVQNRNNNRNNNVQNINNNRNNRYINNYLCRERIYVSLAMILIISSIANIALLTVVANTINDNYINLNNLTNTTECVENNKGEIFISCLPDYLIQGIYTFIIFIMSGFFSIKNKYIYFTVIFGTFIISYSLNLYRYITFNKYLDIMNNIDYCKDINSNIRVEKIFLLIEIIVLGVGLTLFMIINTIEYFYRKNNNDN
jgi:hypothetical protein